MRLLIGLLLALALLQQFAAAFFSAGPLSHALATASSGAARSSRTATSCTAMNILGSIFGQAQGAADAISGNSIFDYTVKDANGKDVALSSYKGKAKAFVIVNVATKWGLTSQNYKELAELYSKYSGKGLEVFGFPCNQFGGQEPGSNAEIQQFAKSQGAKFPIFAKIEVNGEGADPLYKFLKAKQGGLLPDIKWNFSKFLVSADGQPIKRYAPPESPLSLIGDIEKLL